jgi:hypothetical protein
MRFCFVFNSRRYTTQLIAPLVFVPITWFGASGGWLGVASLLSPVVGGVIENKHKHSTDS